MREQNCVATCVQNDEWGGEVIGLSSPYTPLEIMRGERGIDWVPSQ